MSAFFPIISWILIGILGGLAVNFTSDWLSIRRELVSEEFASTFPSRNYWLAVLIPRRFPAASFAWNLRVGVVHVFMIASSILLGYMKLPEVPFWWGYPLLVYLIVVVVMDIEHRLILHPVSIFGAGLGLLLGTYLHGLWPTLLGGVFGFGMMYLMYRLGAWSLKWMKRWRGEEEEEAVPLGFGDVNLAGVMGLLLGWPGIWAGFFVMALAGGLIGGLYLLLMVILKRYRSDLAMPYGPFIVLAILTLLYFRAFY